MSHKQRLITFIGLLCLLLLLPTTAFARKSVWKARLSTGSELHTVVGSNASGSMVLATNADGSLHFVLRVINLSGPVGGAHLHGPADASQNAPVLITLCGNPAPSATGGCVVDSSGTMYIEGNIDSSLLAASGINGATLFGYLDSELIYVNVHTGLNPSGETRGQLLRQ